MAPLDEARAIAHIRVMTRTPPSMPLLSSETTELLRSSQFVDYPEAVIHMERRVAEIAAGQAPEQLWLLEHDSLYTAGTSAQKSDLIMPDRFPVFQSGRGGQYTYHGPGQRVGYVMLNLSKRGRDVRIFVQELECWIIDSLAELGVRASMKEGRIGVWVDLPDGREAKIAALGVRMRKWVSYHGISINVAPDLSHFGGIVPCGISEHGVTSLAQLGVTASIKNLDDVLIANFKRRFGPLD